MKSHPLQYLLFVILIIHAASYSLPGDWKLKNIDGDPTDKDITLRISETVNSDGDIKNVLNFSNCHNINYQVNIRQNFMSIDQSQSNSTNQNNSTSYANECSQEETKLQKRIAQTLKKVFFFAIKEDLLIFVSPNGNDLFEFTRIKKIYLTNLTGTWLLDVIYWERASNTEVKWTQDNVTFCQGKLVANYTTNNIDEIQFNIIQNNNCSQANLTKALQQIRYYRLKDTELELFDKDSVQIIQLVYKNGNGLKQEEKIVTDSKPQITSPKGGSVTIIESQNPTIIDQNVQNNLRSDNSANKSSN